MTERVWTDAEIAAFKAAEPQLAARGMHVEGPKGEANGKQFMRWFDLNPQQPVTVETLLWLFEQHKKKPNAIFFKSDAQLRFEKIAQGMPSQDLDKLGKFLKASRLWPDDEGAYHNGALFISVMTGRPYDTSTLASRIPYIQRNLREQLIWKAASQTSTYRLSGKHSSGDAHFARKNETNVGPSFVGRIDHAKHPSTEIPRPAPASAKMDTYQWDRLSSTLSGEPHSDTAVIQRAIKAAGGGEAGYRAGVAEQKRIRMERERG